MAVVKIVGADSNENTQKIVVVTMGTDFGFNKDAVTFVWLNERVAKYYGKSESYICPIPLSCCAENPCVNIMEGTCQNSNIAATAGKTYHSGYCPSPKWPNNYECLA